MTAEPTAPPAAPPETPFRSGHTPGFPELLTRQTGMPASLAESPLTCVAEGAGRSLEGLRGLPRKARVSRRYTTTSPYRRPSTPAERAAQALQRD